MSRQTTHLEIQGMSCANCSQTITDARGDLSEEAFEERRAKLRSDE